MEIIPIAADSLGVRSMATLVKTDDVKIVIDPDAALGPSRYGLPPHPLELEALKRARERAHTTASESDIIVVSHYHFDHFSYDLEPYRGKRIYAKSTKEHINKSQRARGEAFWSEVSKIAQANPADGVEIKEGKVRMCFSPAVPHGPPGVRLGFVVMTLVEEKLRFIHTSDVQGPVAEETAEWIIERKPDIVYVDGPPVLFLGWKFSHANLEKAASNFQRILDETKAEVILDHHLLRSLDYKEKFPFFDNPRVKTAAEYLGLKNSMLEAHRRDLYKKK